MNGLRAWSFKALALVIVMLATVGAWEIYKGTTRVAREASAQEGDIVQMIGDIHRVVVVGDGDFPGLARLHFKCYQVSPGGISLNQPVEVFDQFHRPPDGENLTLRAVHTLCTPALKLIPEAGIRGR